MWIYQKQMIYPINITTPDPRMAKLLMAQYGGPDSELSAGLRYLSQRFSMPDDRVKATLTDIGTEASQVGKNAVSSPFCPDFSVSSAADFPKKLNFCGRHFKYTSMCSRSCTTMRSRISR